MEQAMRPAGQPGSSQSRTGPLVDVHLYVFACADAHVFARDLLAKPPSPAYHFLEFPMAPLSGTSLFRDAWQIWLGSQCFGRKVSTRTRASACRPLKSSEHLWDLKSMLRMSETCRSFPGWIKKP